MALPGMASKPMSKVELRISCRKLINTDITSKSDPCAVLFVKQGGDWVEHGRTENIQNSLDPDFAKAFAIDYMFEEVQNVKVAVYDLDNTTPNLGDDDFLGQVECTLGQIVAARPFHKPVLLKNGKPAGQGSIIIRSEEVKEGGEVAVCTFRARKLENKDGLFGKSDPFLEIRKGNPDGSWQVVHRTEVVKNNLNPHWRPFTVPVHSLCGGDKSKLVKFDVYDYDSDGSHDLMGGFTASMQELEASQGKEFPCIEEKKKAKKKKYENSGFIILDSIKVKRVASFLEFIYGGTQINFTVGVDFTGSNGDPSSPDSLHYINPYQPNEYMQAIQAVGMVCQDYDSDKMFPALGFGAKLPTGAVSHEFAMNFNPQNPFCAGIQGIVQAYQNCVPQIQLWGPTNVAPIIHHVAKFAAGAQQEEQTKGAHAYYVLLLLTDGVITDMDATRSAIVHASALPMSLIIVGVGGADFSDMQMLDGDDGVLKAPNGQPVHRDIVQFVPFRDFNKPNNPTSSAAELARHVLAEVPQQVTHYYNWRGMQPNQAMAPPM